MPPERASGSEPVVEVRRSRRRRRTVSAYRDGDRVVVLMPAGFTAVQEQTWVRDMLRRLGQREQRRRRATPAGDAELLARASTLSRRYLPGGPRPASVRWVDNQRHRWGSCTPATGTIRLSERLRDLPGYVSDYVLIHELAHLQVSGHGAEFWALVAGYRHAERARGYLEGLSAAAGLSPGWGELAADPGARGADLPGGGAAAVRALGTEPDLVSCAGPLTDDVDGVPR